MIDLKNFIHHFLFSSMLTINICFCWILSTWTSMLAIKTIHSSLIYMYKEEVKKATSLTNKQSPWQRNTGTICLCSFINADICVLILQVQGWLSSLFIQRTNNFWSSDIFNSIFSKILYIFNTICFHISVYSIYMYLFTQFILPILSTAIYRYNWTYLWSLSNPVWL